MEERDIRAAMVEIATTILERKLKEGPSVYKVLMGSGFSADDSLRADKVRVCMDNLPKISIGPGNQRKYSE